MTTPDVAANAPSATPAKAGRLRLVASVGARWPEPIAALGAKLLRPEKLLTKLASPKAWPCWLGYVSPIALLIQEQPASAAALEELLDTWLEHTATFLEARQYAPERCRLLNLSHLEGPALSLLLNEVSDDELEIESDGPSADEASVAAELPLLLQLYLQRRPDVLNRYADLEGQAELLGREPEFSLPLSRPDADSWAALLLNSWEAEQLREASANREELEQAQQQLQEAREEAELTLLQLHQVQEELEHNFLEHRKSQEQITALEAQLSAATTTPEELEQLQDAREEAELTLLQLHQVQEELELQFLEHRKAAQERDELKQQLESLRAEMGYYFLLSRADPCLDNSRIPQLKALMRATLIRG